MNFSHKQWMYGGAALLVAVSGTIMVDGVPSARTPMPLPILLVALFTTILSLLITPALYLLVLKLTSSSVHFAKFILALVAILGALNIMYFYSSWEYGVRYLGAGHTKTVALENILGFSIVMAIAIAALGKGSKALAYSANLVLFILLSWCAFPYLGTLP